MHVYELSEQPKPPTPPSPPPPVASPPVTPSRLPATAAVAAGSSNSAEGDGGGDGEVHMLRHELSNTKVSLAEAVSAHDVSRRDVLRAEQMLQEARKEHQRTSPGNLVRLASGGMRNGGRYGR